VGGALSACRGLPALPMAISLGFISVMLAFFATDKTETGERL
jgi:hypothetical protein